MIINHNIAALNTHRQLSSASAGQAKSMEKLASGLRINKAGDDAAGLAISEKMRGQIRGLDMASKNAQDGISMIQTAEGALNETHDILQRMRELATQAGNDTNTTEDRGEIQKEINQLTSEINRIGNTTEFNTQKLINGDKVATTTTATNITGAANTTGGVDAASPDPEVKSSNTFTIASLPSEGDKLKIGSTDIAFYNSTSGTYTNANDAATKLGVNATNLIDTNGKNAGQVATAVAALSVAGVSLTSPTTGAVKVTSTATGIAGDGTVVEYTGKSTTTGGVSLQIGANQNQSLTLDLGDMRASSLGITGTAGVAGFTNTATVTDGTNNATTEAALDVSTSENAAKAITKIQTAIDSVSAERSKLGAYSNRLEHTINNLGTSSENLTAAESRVRDVDMAKEMMTQTKNSILSQAAQAMLAQANQQPQGVLQLLR